MSAIYGIIGKSEYSTEKLVSQMRNGYNRSTIDFFKEIVGNNHILGCGMQLLVTDSDKDIIPIEDDEFVFTADVILDNRDMIAEQLKIDVLPDGMLLFEAFKKWHSNMEYLMEQLYGVFSFCAYRKSDGMIWLVTDHTGSRCVHYKYDGAAFYFGTLIEPIIKIQKEKPQLSEKYVAFCESNCSADLLFFPEITPYDGIYQLECGCYLNGQVGHELNKVRYYYPEKHIKKLRVSDEEGIKLFRNTFSNCVNDVLRSSNETAATLSSGLDSSSVACMATNFLKKNGKKLYSYTSIPLDDYIDDSDEFLVANEKSGVLRLKKYCPEIEMTFVNCPGKNAVTDFQNLIPILECPQKSSVNLVWLDEIYRLAKLNNCNVLVKGQYGNTTISYGTLLTTVYQSVKTGRIIKTISEINKFGVKNRISRKRMIKAIYENYKDIRLNKADIQRECLTSQVLLDKYNIAEEYKILNVNEQNGIMDSNEERINTMWSPRILAHLGAFDTKMGLYHGLVIRDPTKDRRIMELCLGLPITCFAGNGYERRLVREGMEGIVPADIRLDINHRGNQGADYAFRIQKDWDSLRLIVKNYICNIQLTQFLDEKEIDFIKTIVELDKNAFIELTDDNPKVIVKMLVICSLAEFLYEYERK